MLNHIRSLLATERLNATYLMLQTTRVSVEELLSLLDEPDIN